MTHPDGPADPPGPSWGGAITPSWGERIAAQFFQEYDARWGADPRTTPYEARLPDLARRIDAALAEREAMVAALREALLRRRTEQTLRLNAHKFVEEQAPLLLPNLTMERNALRTLVRQLTEALRCHSYGFARDGQACFCATDTGVHGSSCLASRAALAAAEQAGIR